MDHLALLIDLHKEASRQGPGGTFETEKAIALAMLDPAEPLKIADIGCGTGASAILLAKRLHATVTAVDVLPEFIDILVEKARLEGVADKLDPLVCSMDALPFADADYDVIWSEGAIYNIGFARGIQEWRRFLKPGGTLVVSEITWSTESRPAELQAHWQKEYPDIDTASAKFHLLEQNGYTPTGYFLLPEHCWLDNYYRPLQDTFAAFLARNGHSRDAEAIVRAERAEIALYEKYRAYYSYGVYIARKHDETA